MNTKIFLTFGLMAVVLVSCYQEYPDQAHFGKPIQVNAIIEGSQTRASDISWAANDAIAVYMKKSGFPLNSPALAENVKYVTADGSPAFLPADPAKEITIPANGVEVDFIAYYPYKSTIAGLQYPVDLSDQSKQEVIDLMYSDNVRSLTFRNPDVHLNFVHQLSKVILNISSEKPEYSLTGLRAKITNVGLTSSFSLIDGTLSLPASMGNVFLKMSADGLFAEGILLPDNDLNEKELILIVGEDSYTLPLSAFMSALNKSTKYTVTIVLKPATNPVANVSAVSITDWISSATSATIDQDNTPYLGSQSNPYTVADAIINQSESNVWVKGYVVGYYTGTTYSSYTYKLDNVQKITNIALAANASDTIVAKTFPVSLSSGDVQNALNLRDHPENFGKEIMLNGDLSPYFSVSGMKNVKKAYVDGVIYPQLR